MNDETTIPIKNYHQQRTNNRNLQAAYEALKKAGYTFTNYEER